MLPWLLLPGTLCTDEVFDPVLSDPGLAGRLGPALPFAGYGVPTAEAAAERLLREAPAEFGIIAFSAGAFVALEAALAGGARVRRLVLVGATARADRPENRPIREALLRDAERMGRGALVRERLWEGYVAPGRQDDAALRERIAAMAEATPQAEFAAQTGIALSRRDLLAQAHRVACPVLVVHGALDAATPPDRGEELVAALPRGSRAVIEGAGHFVLLERPAEVAAAVAAWIGATHGATNGRAGG